MLRRLPATELPRMRWRRASRSEEHTSELQSLRHLVCRLLLEKKKQAIFRRSAGDEDTNDAERLSFDPTMRQVVGGRATELFFNDTATTEIYTLSLHDALPIWLERSQIDLLVARARTGAEAQQQ